MKKFALATLLLIAAGCVPPSMNLQRAALRGGGDTAVTAVLGEVSDENFDDTFGKVKSIVDGVAKFLDDGKIADLTQSQLSDEIMKLVPVKYKAWADQLLAVASGVVVSEDQIAKVGVDNVRRLKAFLKGTKTGLTEYKKEDRKKPEPEPEAPPVEGGPQPAQPDGQPIDTRVQPAGMPAQPDSN